MLHLSICIIMLSLQSHEFIIGRILCSEYETVFSIHVSEKGDKAIIFLVTLCQPLKQMQAATDQAISVFRR